jgi:hypothetical protein
MMAMSEDRPEEDRGVSMKNIAVSALLTLLLLLSIGGVAGAIAGLIESPENWGEATLAMAGAALVGAAAALGLRRLKPWAGSGEPISPKTRKANNLMLLSGALGALIGAALAISTISLDQPWALFSNSPMAPAVVIPVIAVWLLLVPLVSWQWHRSVDEHEAEAYKFGGLAGLYLYAFLAPAWWLAWRGGLVPEPDTMLVYLLVLLVWSVGWFWRRYR